MNQATHPQLEALLAHFVGRPVRLSTVAPGNARAHYADSRLELGKNYMAELLRKPLARRPEQWNALAVLAHELGHFQPGGFHPPGTPGDVTREMNAALENAATDWARANFVKVLRQFGYNPYQAKNAARAYDRSGGWKAWRPKG
jgi:hypothetical protein